MPLARPGQSGGDGGWLPGGEIGVLATFFGLSILSGFALKRLFGVTL